MKKKGFTLIELLAVIVILAIIALIATPIILGIIKDAKENAFKSSIDGIVRTALTESVLNIKGEDILYKYEKNTWTENKLNIDGEIPKYVEIKVNKDGQVKYAITDGVYCATKEYDSKSTIKKINDERFCSLTTPEVCFRFGTENNTTSIVGYRCYEGNTKGLPTITDVVIPEKVNSIIVGVIGGQAFEGKNIESVVLPSNLTIIGSHAFLDNELTSVVIPDSVTSIGNFAFSGNELTSVIIPSNVTSISNGAFGSNKLTSVIIKGKSTSNDFEYYWGPVFGWAEGYSDDDIIWEGSN